MATALADYKAALAAVLASPTPALAAAAANTYAVLSKSVSGDRTAASMPDLPEWVSRLAGLHQSQGERILLARPTFGDGR